MTRMPMVRPVLAGRVVGLGLGRVAWAGAGVALLSGATLAGPEGEKVRHGQATFTRRGDATVIRASDRAIIDYRSFDIAAHESVRFVQPSSEARVLNRIQGSDPTRIDGSLSANGRVYIVNPAGVYFGDGALVNVGSIYAAAAHLSDADFLNNVDHFTQARGEVINRGTIAAHRVALVGRHVTNAGVIVAPEGSVAMAAGDDVLIGEEDGHIFARFSGGAGTTDSSSPGVVNTGEVRAEGGEVVFGAGDAFAVAIDLPGAVRAASIRAEANAGAVTVSGTLDASATTPGERGGRVEVLGENVGIFGGDIDASGPAGGGTILVGGDFQGRGETPTASKTIVSPGSTLRADATADGDGGRIIVWADGWTAYQGSLSARGAGTGDGGFAEVSGKESLLFRGKADLSSSRGDAGGLLLDPKNIIIENGGGGALTNITFASNPSGDETFDADAITALTNAGTDVTLQANNDITVNEDIITVAGGNGGDLTLQAGRSIAINADITTDNGSLTLIANETVVNGVINGEREGGLPAVLAIGPTRVVDAGSGAVVFTVGTGAGLTNNASSALFMAGTLIGGAVTLTDEGPDDGGVTVGPTGQLFGVATVMASEGNVTLDGPVVAGTLDVHGGTDGLGDVAVNAPITTVGDITIFGETSIINAGGTIESGGGDVSLRANNNVTLRNLNSGGGDLTVLADLDASGLGSFLQVNTTSSRTFGGDIHVSTVNAILNGSLNAGAGSIRVQPSVAAGTMGLAGGAGTLQLDSVELRARLLTTSSVTLGRDDGTGLVDCRPLGFTTSTPFDLTIRGGAIQIGALFLGAAGTPSLSLIANSGSVTLDGGAIVAVPDGGNIVFGGDDVVLPLDTRVLTGSGGSVSFIPNSGRTVGVGGGAGDFSLSADEINLVFAGTLVIGSSTSGRMTVGTVAVPPSVTSLSLVSGADIVESVSNTTPDATVAGRLILDAQSGVGEAGVNGALDVNAQQVDASVSGPGSIRLRLSGGPTLFAAETADGEVEVTASSGDLVVGTVLAGNGSTITLAAEAGGVFDDTLFGTQVETTGAVVLSAATGIGQNGGPGGSGTSMDLRVGAAAAVATGGIALRLIDPDAGGVLVGATSTGTGDIGISSDPGGGTVAVSGLNANAGSITVDTNDAPLDVAGPVAADSGSSTGGTVTFLDIGALNVAGPISTAGGAVAITSADIALTGTINAGTGQVTLQPSTDTRTVDLGATAPAQFSLSNAEAGLITASTLVVGRPTSTTPITVGLLDLAGGTANLTLRTGAAVVEESSNNTLNLRVDGLLTLIALGGVGGAAPIEALDIEAGRFAATASDSGINVRSASDLVLETVSAGIHNVALTTTGSLLDGNGAAVNVVGQDVSLLASGAIGSGADPLDLAASRIVAQSTTAGSVTLHQTGPVTLTGVIAAAGDVTIIVAGGSVALNEVRAGGGGNITLTIPDGNLAEAGGGDPAADLVGSGLTLAVGGGVGVGNAIETDLGTVVSSSSSGGLFLTDLGSITLSDVRDAQGHIEVRAAADLAVDAVEAVLGNVTLAAAAGNLTAIDGDPQDDICGTNVSLSAGGSIGGGPFALQVCEDACLTVAATGSVTLSSAGDMLLDSVSGASVTLTAAGSILECVGDGGLPEITAATATLSAGADIRGEAPGAAMEIDVGTLTAAAGGQVSLRGVGAGLTLASVTAGGPVHVSTANGNLLVNLVNAGGGSGAVTLAADIGAIDEFGADAAADILGGAVSLSARSGIGHAAAIEIDAATISASVNGPGGDIRLAEATGATLLSLTAPGFIDISAAGPLTANAVSGGAVALSAGSILVPGIVESSGAVLINAGTVTVKGDVSGSSVTLRGAGVGVGGIGIGSGASVASAGDLTIETTRTFTNQEPLAAGGSLTIRDAGTANLNADLTAADALTLANVPVVNLAGNVDLSAGAGGVSAAAGVGAIHLTGASGVNVVTTSAGGDIALAAVTAASEAGLTIDSAGSATLGTVVLPGASGAALAVTVDADGDGAEALTAGALRARTVVLSGGNAANADDTLILNGGITAGASLTIRDAADARFALDAGANAESGDLIAQAGVGRIVLLGDGANVFTAGEGSVFLAPVVSDTGASLEVAAGRSASLRGVDLAHPADDDGSLSVAIDTNNDTPDAILVVGAIAAGRVGLSGGSTLDDRIVLNGATATTLGPVVVDRAATLAVNRAVDAAAGITFSNVGSVNVRPGAHLTARGGNLSVFSNVGRVFLAAGAGDTTFAAATDHDATFSRIEAATGATGALEISAGGSVNVASAALTGALSILADSDGGGTESLTAGPLRAASVTLTGRPGVVPDESLVLNGEIVSTSGGILIRSSGEVAINAAVHSARGITVRDSAAVTLGPGVPLTAGAGSLWFSLNVGEIRLAGGGFHTFTASADAVFGPVTSDANSLAINAGRSITLAPLDLNQGDLSLCFDSDGSGDGELTLSSINARSVAIGCGPGSAFPGGPTILTGDITAAGGIVFDAPVVLSAPGLAITSTGGDVRFNSTLDSADGTVGRDLAVTGGEVAFGGAVGSAALPRDVIVTHRDRLLIDADIGVARDFRAGGGGDVRLAASVHAGGSVSVARRVSLAADATLRGNAGGVTLGSAVDGARHLVLAGQTGVVTIGSDVGAAASLLSLTVNADLRFGGSTIAAGALTFNGHVDALSTGQSLSLTSLSTTRIRGHVGALQPGFDSVAVNGPMTIGGSAPVTITTSGIQVYAGPVRLAGHTTLDAGGDIHLLSSLDGAFDFAAASGAGSLHLAGNVGGTAPLAVASIDAPVVIQSDLSISAAEAHFIRTIDAAVPDVGLTLATTEGGAFFDGDIGFAPGLQPLESLDVTGSINIASAGTPVRVRTSGAQVWRGDVSLGSDTTFISTAPAGSDPADRIAFLDDVTDGDGSASLTVNNPDDTRFVGRVAVSRLATDAAGRTVIAGPSVATSGSQTFADIVVVESPELALSGEGLFFGQSLASSGPGAPAVVISDVGTTVFGGPVEGVSPGLGHLGSLSISGGGTTLIAGGSVRTSGGQDYANPVQFANQTRLSASDVRFRAAIGSAPTPTPEGSFADLTIAATNTIFEPAASGLPLGSLAVVGGTTIDRGITTANGQTYTGPVVIGAGVSLTSAASGDVVFNGDVFGPGRLHVTTAGATRFMQDVSVREVETDGGGDTEIRDALVQTIGTQTWRDRVLIAQTTTFTAASGSAVRLLGGLAPLPGAVDPRVTVALAGPGSTADVAGDFAAGAFAFDAPVVVAGGTSINATQSIEFLGTLDGSESAPGAPLMLHVAEVPVPVNRQPITDPIPTVRFVGDIGVGTPLGSLRIGDPDNPRQQPPAVASVIAGPADLDDTNTDYTLNIVTDGPFVMGLNEKLTVLGSLNVEAGEAELGDITALRAIRVAADRIRIIGRESGAIATVTAGELLAFTDGDNSERADNSGTDFAASESIAFEGDVTRVGAGVDSNVRFATNTGEGITGVDAFVRTSVDPPVDPGTLVFRGGSAPIVLDVKAGSAPNNVASSLAGALPREQDVLDVPQDAVSVLSVANELQEIGILLDRIGMGAIESALGRALYEDLRMPPTARRHANEPRAGVLAAAEEVYYKPSRLSGEAALEMRDTIRDLFLYKDDRAQLSVVRRAIADAWLDWLDSPGADPRIAGAFGAFLQSSDPDGVAARCVQSLGVLFDQIDGLGLTDYERTQVRRFVVKKIAPERVTPEAFELAAFGNGDEHTEAPPREPGGRPGESPREGQGAGD